MTRSEINESNRQARINRIHIEKRRATVERGLLALQVVGAITLVVVVVMKGVL